VDRVERLQERVEELTAELRRLEARVRAIEAGSAGVAAPSPAPDEGNADLRLPAIGLPQGMLALLGRTLMVLAGAYLVRAMTEEGVVPSVVGISLGLAYAAFWQLRARSDGRAGRRESAAFHGLAGSLIAYPLIWEATARFGLLAPRAAGAALIALFGLGLWAALGGGSAVNATLSTGLSLTTTVALLVSTHDLLAALVTLLAITAGLEWLAWSDRWRPLRWPAAVVADGVAILLAVVVTRPQGLPEGYVALSGPAAAAALLALPLVFVVSLAVRTMVRERPVTPFGVLQGSAALLLGLGGAWRVLESRGLSTMPLGILAVLLGALCYGAAFFFAERRAGQGRNFYFYSTAGGLLTLGGTSALGLGPALGLVWSGLGLAAALLGRRFSRMTLRLHAAVYFAAAAVLSGLVASCTEALAGREIDPLSVLAWPVAAGLALGYVVLATDPRAPRAGWDRLPELVLALLVTSAALLVMSLGAGAVLGALTDGDPGAAATVRTGVLALVVAGLAWLTRRCAWPELGWLVYPLLVVGGIRLLLHDLPDGRAATLVLSLALFGGVLILTPRLLRREGS
jgi:hypothetical protein